MRGKLAVVSGFSGAGKGTVVRRLMEDNGGYALSVSMTTRQPRNDEQNGREYHFVTNERFEAMIRENGFLEHAGYVDHYYGTPLAFVEDNRNAGVDVLLEIEVQGAMQIRKRHPEAVLIFVSPPTAEELERRLVGRGTESEEKITDRLRRGVEESSTIVEYPYLVINDSVADCAASLHEIIQGDLSAAARGDGGKTARTGGRIITDLQEKADFAGAFREGLLKVLARRGQ